MVRGAGTIAKRPDGRWRLRVSTNGRQPRGAEPACSLSPLTAAKPLGDPHSSVLQRAALDCSKTSKDLGHYHGVSLFGSTGRAGLKSRSAHQPT